MARHYEELIEHLRNGTKLPMLQELMNEAADAIQDLLIINNGHIQYSTIIYDQEEIHENCTVQIWKNSATGEVSIGWWENQETAE